MTAKLFFRITIGFNVPLYDYANILLHYLLFTASVLLGKSKTSFRCGAWSETHDVLGVADDSDTIYLIRANGEEITRISKSHIKSSSPIVGLMVQDDVDLKKSCL